MVVLFVNFPDVVIINGSRNVDLAKKAKHIIFFSA